jgi:hypothetical protein
VLLIIRLTLIPTFLGPGIYHGSLKLAIDTEDHIDSAALLPYPDSETDAHESALSLSLTEFHFVLLYKDKVVGICNLNDKVTYEESLPLVRRLFMSTFAFPLIWISRKAMKLSSA